jgi:hypothetical protein
MQHCRISKPRKQQSTRLELFGGEDTKEDVYTLKKGSNRALEKIAT